MGPPGTVLDWTPDGSGWSRLVPLRQPMRGGCGKATGRATGPRLSTAPQAGYGHGGRTTGPRRDGEPVPSSSSPFPSPLKLSISVTSPFPSLADLPAEQLDEESLGLLLVPTADLEVHHGLAHRRISVCLFAVTCPELQAGDAPVLNRPQRATSSRTFTPFGCTNRCTDGMVTAMARGGKQIQSRVPWRMTSATLK